MKKQLTLFLITIISVSTMFGQNVKDNRGKKPLLYDDWPVTVESNAKGVKPPGDVNVNFVPIGTTWDHRIITYFFQNGTNDIAGNNERQAVRDAFALWSAQTDLYFVEACTDANADIVFLWGVFNHGDAGPFDGENGTLAHTLGGPPPNTFGNQAGDIHFDDSETWTLETRPNNIQPIDLVSVAAHEIGHALGLNHTTVAGSLMLATYTGSHRFLGSDEIAGIRSLYGLPQTNIPITGASPICTNSTYALVNQPAGTTVVWSSSNPTNLSINPNTGVATKQNNFNGQVTVSALINSGCGTVSVSRSVQVGIFTQLQVTVSGTAAVCPGNYYTYYANVPGGHIPGFTYQWSWPANWYFQGQWDNRLILSPPMYSPVGGGIVSVTVNNGCGSSSPPSGITVYQGYGCYTYSYNVSPSPVENILTVELTMDSGETMNESTAKENELTRTLAEFQVELIADDGQKLLTQRSVEGAVKLDTKSFRKGLYLIRIVQNDIVTIKRVILK